jgi:cyanophycin synthetase
MDINIGDLYTKPTKDIENFNETLLSLIPGLSRHYCSLGYEGGFAERLKEGTYIGHVTEHLILELQSMLGYDVSYGKTRVVKEPSSYFIVYEYVNEKCAIECGRTAVRIIKSILRNEKVAITDILVNLKKIALESELGPSTKGIFDEAGKRGIPVTRVGNESLLQLGYGKYSRLIEASLTDYASCISIDMVGNKFLTKEILNNNSIPVPYGDIAYNEETAVRISEEIGYPVVIKPYNGNQGKGVILNISSEEQVRSAFKESLKYSKAAVIEKFVKGKDYRVLVVGGKVSAVSERRPPCVLGDGIHTVKELLDIENSSPLRGDDHEKPLTKIKVENVTLDILAKQGRDLNSIPAAGETIYLRYNSNLSTGGTARDCTDEIHPYNRDVFIRTARVLGLDIAGIDATMEDISVPLNPSNGAVIEVNAAPGLRMHLYPSEGQARNVAKDIVNMMFPEDKPYSVPIISITGTNGKTTTTRMIRHTLSLMGRKVGMTSTAGIFIGDDCILKGDNTGPVSARIVLSNREVEAAVLETARGGIIRRGLGYDLADVGVITNIADDHLGIDGINTLEELAFAKSLVIEAVKPDGYSVLNADDQMVEYLLKRAAGNVFLFSANGNNPMLKKHIKDGGKAAFVQQDIIVIHDDKDILLIDLKEIPITFNGTVSCNIENSLAAVSALYALGIPSEIIEMGLKSFKPDIVSNPGRFNLLDIGNFKVLLDYGHNPAGYKAVGDFVKTVDAKRCIGIIGAPGDRKNENIREIGSISSTVFSKIYIKEDYDLRGRKQGEVSEILYNSLVENGFGKENIKVVLQETKAFETAMLDAQPGDLIVLFYQEFDEALELVDKFKNELDTHLDVNMERVDRSREERSREERSPEEITVSSGIIEKIGQK